MNLKKTAASKRTSPPRRTDYYKDFIKDWERLSRSGKYDLNKLKEIMLLLISNSGPLPSEYKDHALIGNWSGYRECHVGGDFLLIYRVDDTKVPGYIIFQVPELTPNYSENRISQQKIRPFAKFGGGTNFYLKNFFRSFFKKQTPPKNIGKGRAGKISSPEKLGMQCGLVRCVEKKDRAEKALSFFLLRFWFLFD